VTKKQTKKQLDRVKELARERKKRQRESEKSSGIIEIGVKCHKDDAESIRAYGKKKLNKRKRDGSL